MQSWSNLVQGGHHFNSRKERKNWFTVFWRELEEVYRSKFCFCLCSRFGPSITSWKNSVTLREYMSQGLTDWAMQHAITSAFYASVMWFNGNLRFNFVSLDEET